MLYKFDFTRKPSLATNHTIYVILDTSGVLGVSRANPRKWSIWDGSISNDVKVLMVNLLTSWR